MPLDGLAMAFMGQNPDNTGMMESFGNWNFANLYVDEKATPEQRKALLGIAGQIWGSAAPAERTKVTYVPVTHRMEGKEHVVTFGVSFRSARIRRRAR